MPVESFSDNRHFYPRSPCGERPFITTITICTVSFLSTLSLRRATTQGVFNLFANPDFYPRSPCGERLNGISLIVHIGGFLSTLSLRRATDKSNKLVGLKLVFLSTLSLRRATESQQPCERPTTYFYPRSPCGERRQSIQKAVNMPHFYPRSPCGERRCEMISIERCSLISIHALLAESDP